MKIFGYCLCLGFPLFVLNHIWYELTGHELFGDRNECKKNYCKHNCCEMCLMNFLNEMEQKEIEEENDMKKPKIHTIQNPYEKISNKELQRKAKEIDLKMKKMR